MTEPLTSNTLNDLQILDELSDRERQRLVDIAQIVNVETDDVIFREGERHRFIYWLLDGQVILEMSTGGTIPKSLLTLGRGDLLAWSAMLGNGRMSASGVAKQPTRLLRFDGAELVALCQDNYEIGFRIMEHIAQRLAGRLLATRLQLLDLFRDPNEPSV